jgi:hypothetical protein
MIACMQTSDWEPEHTECVGTAGVKTQFIMRWLRKVK